eukprot:3101955-Ditylum_brightwellii.AAC.1
MRAAKERPSAEPPWATLTSTTHPLHPLKQTPTITNNQEKQTKRLASTASPPNLYSSIQPPTSKSFQYKFTYAHPAEL